MTATLSRGVNGAEHIPFYLPGAIPNSDPMIARESSNCTGQNLIKKPATNVSIYEKTLRAPHKRRQIWCPKKWDLIEAICIIVRVNGRLGWKDLSSQVVYGLVLWINKELVKKEYLPQQLMIHWTGLTCSCYMHNFQIVSISDLHGLSLYTLYFKRITRGSGLHSAVPTVISAIDVTMNDDIPWCFA